MNWSQYDGRQLSSIEDFLPYVERLHDAIVIAIGMLPEELQPEMIKLLTLQEREGGEE